VSFAVPIVESAGKTAVLDAPYGIITDSEGRVTNAPRYNEYIRQVVRSLFWNITLGNGEDATRVGPFEAQYRVAVFTKKNEDQIIGHGLGRQPVGYLVVGQNANGAIFVPDVLTWTDEYIVLQSTEITTYKIIIF